LRDRASHVFRFPAFALMPLGEVRVWTRKGTNDAQNLYWGREQAVWNNAGDTATLSDPTGQPANTFTYP